MNSTWTLTAGKDGHSYPALEGDVQAEVAIIGGGIVGVTCAYLLSKAGKKVALISDGTDEETTTAYTTGFLNAPLDTPLVELCELYGYDKAKMMWESGQAAIDHIEETARQEHIECDLVRCSLYLYANEEKDLQDLKQEGELGRKMGFSIASHAPGDLPFKNVGSIELKGQGKFHALKYIRALKAVAKEAGARIFDNTKAERIEVIDEKRVVHTGSGRIVAGNVIVATYYPFDKPRELFAHTGGYVTYVIESELPKGTLEEAMYVDSNNPYHYLRVDHEGSVDRLIAGGEDHREEIPMEEKNFRALERYYRTILGRELPIRRQWKWGIVEPADGLPYIGPLKQDDHELVVTGLSGTGLTMSRIATEIISDMLLGKKNEWADLYSTLRKPTAKQLIKKGSDYISELMGGAAKNIFE